jgi:hypothetical protein
MKQKRQKDKKPSSLPDLGEYLAANSPKTIEEALQMTEAKAADPNRKPISRFFGTLPGAFGGDAWHIKGNFVMSGTKIVFDTCAYMTLIVAELYLLDTLNLSDKINHMIIKTIII